MVPAVAEHAHQGIWEKFNTQKYGEMNTLRHLCMEFLHKDTRVGDLLDNDETESGCSP